MVHRAFKFKKSESNIMKKLLIIFPLILLMGVGCVEVNNPILIPSSEIEKCAQKFQDVSPQEIKSNIYTFVCVPRKCSIGSPPRMIVNGKEEKINVESSTFTWENNSKTTTTITTSTFKVDFGPRSGTVNSKGQCIPDK